MLLLATPAYAGTPSPSSSSAAGDTAACPTGSVAHTYPVPTTNDTGEVSTGSFSYEVEALKSNGRTMRWWVSNSYDVPVVLVTDKGNPPTTIATQGKPDGLWYSYQAPADIASFTLCLHKQGAGKRAETIGKVLLYLAVVMAGLGLIALVASAGNSRRS
jgi:hypothetical protein